MKRYTLMGEKQDKILLPAFLFVLLYLCRDTNFSNAVLGVDVAAVLTAALVFCAGVLFLLKNRKQWKEILLDRRMLMMALYALVFLTPMVLKRDWQLMYFSVLLCLLIAVFMTYVSNWRDIARYYIVIMTALGIYSMIGKEISITCCSFVPSGILNKTVVCTKICGHKLPIIRAARNHLRWNFHKRTPIFRQQKFTVFGKHEAL